DIFLTQTAELAHVVLPAAAGWAESDGTVTNSERRVQRVRRALEPPPGARDDIDIICELARRMGSDWGHPTAEQVWDECRALSPMHAGMAYRRLEELGGLQWPCPDESHPGTQFLHARLWKDPVEGPRAPFHAVEHDPPVDRLTEEFPIRLTTGRRLDSFNTGVQTNAYTSPLRRGEALLISPEDGESLGLADGECGRASSRPATAEEVAAVDGLLGEPEKAHHHLAYGGRATRSERHMLLPVLHAIQDRVGWVSRGALEYSCRRLSIPPAEAYGVVSFYARFALE